MGNARRVKVTVVREGYFRWLEKYTAAEVSSTSTLIESGGKRILVDVPNAGEGKELLKALKKLDISPDSIDIVVVTHFHPDHTGCLHLFPNAEYVSGGVRWKGEEHRYWLTDSLDLTEDVVILKTPGHTPESCTVIARTKDFVYAMAGDMWAWPHDARLLTVSDEATLKENRKKILEMADVVVPGHAGAAPSTAYEI